jgi:hypothetical protein
VLDSERSKPAPACAISLPPEEDLTDIILNLPRSAAAVEQLLWTAAPTARAVTEGGREQIAPGGAL